jgi:hypothetical protein
VRGKPALPRALCGDNGGCGAEAAAVATYRVWRGAVHARVAAGHPARAHAVTTLATLPSNDDGCASSAVSGAPAPPQVAKTKPRPRCIILQSAPRAMERVPA